ncbi:ABC transporter ATP-binding protein [Alphaproteobacteria bacterium]|nr:ABC transporter ATP-binding protein [Alphaproteobacteria bacterium]
MLSVSNIEVYYNRVVQALCGLSFSVPEGEIVALLGPNGSGKTTALKAISGLLKIENGELTDGKIFYNKKNISKIPPYALVRSGMSHVREGRRIFPDLTVNENLLVATYALKGRNAKPDFDFIYNLFHPLSSRKNQIAGYLSGGEQQMLALGRALIGNPKIILMDEPSLGLAPKFVDQIFSVIKKINEEFNTTILLVEQNANLAFSIASYVYIIENGKVVINGSVDKIKYDKDVQEFYMGVNVNKRKSYRNVKHYKKRKRWLS